MDTEQVKAPKPVPVTKAPCVTLVAGAVLTRADGTFEQDSGTFTIAASDRVTHKGAAGTALVDKDDGGMLEVHPGADVFCMPYGVAGDFDCRVDGGRGRVIHASTTIAPRRKVLRSPGTTTATLGTTYSWEFDGTNIVVKCEQGFVILSNTLLGWNVTVDTGKKVTFKDSDRVAPVPTVI